MLELDSEYDIIRIESVVMYWSTVFILLVLQLYLLASIYAIGAIIMLGADERVEDMSDEDLFWDDSTSGDSMLSELHGLDLSAQDIEDFIQADTEIPKLSTTTELAENYNIYARKILRKVHVIPKNYTKYISSAISEPLLTETFRSRHASAWQTVDPSEYFEMKRAKGKYNAEVRRMRKQLAAEVIKNNYWRNTYIAMGIYPRTEFDFHLLSQWLRDDNSYLYYKEKKV